jgi:transketolase N-terminal domain/subunit
MNARQLLEYSYQNKLSHIPSALSMLDYVDVLFTEGYVTLDDGIVIGKPFGAQAYYLVWRELGYLENIEQLSVGVKHDEILFVDYGEESMGNALGVAAGIALASGCRIWVNISDAALQMGNTLEALQFIGHNCIENLFVTVDYNNSQVTGTIDDILKVEPVVELCKAYGWHVQRTNGHDRDAIRTACQNLSESQPNIVFFETQKGHGITTMEQDIKKWHYKKIETLEELQSLVAELPAT